MKQESDQQNQQPQKEFNVETFSTWIKETFPSNGKIFPFSQMPQNTAQEQIKQKTRDQILKSSQERIQITNRILQSLKTPQAKVKKLDLMESQHDYDSEKALEQLVESMSKIPKDEIKNEESFQKKKKINHQHDSMIKFLKGLRNPSNPAMIQIVEHPLNNRENPEQDRQNEIITGYLNPLQSTSQKSRELLQKPSQNDQCEEFRSQQIKIETKIEMEMEPQIIYIQDQSSQLQVGQIYLEPLDAELQIIEQQLTRKTELMKIQESSAQLMDEQ